MTLAGTPAANTEAGKLFVITEPLPSVTSLLIITPGRTVTFHGSHALSFILTSANLYELPSSAFCQALCVKIKQYPPIPTPFPIKIFLVVLRYDLKRITQSLPTPI
jgi:hypothetical protein